VHPAHAGWDAHGLARTRSGAGLGLGLQPPLRPATRASADSGRGSA